MWPAVPPPATTTDRPDDVPLSLTYENLVQGIHVLGRGRTNGPGAGPMLVPDRGAGSRGVHPRAYQPRCGVAAAPACADPRGDAGPHVFAVPAAGRTDAAPPAARPVCGPPSRPRRGAPRRPSPASTARASAAATAGR